MALNCAIGSIDDPIDLVRHQQRRRFARADLVQHLLDDADLFFEKRVGQIYQVQQQIGAA